MILEIRTFSLPNAGVFLLTLLSFIPCRIVLYLLKELFICSDMESFQHHFFSYVRFEFKYHAFDFWAGTALKFLILQTVSF